MTEQRVADARIGYGVLIDTHAARQDGGVPTFWDGWYTERALALEALRLAKQRHPGARVQLVKKED